MKYFIIIAFTFLIFHAEAQNTFNKRLHFDYPAAVLTSVEATDSCYYMSGLIVDPMPPNRTGNIFAKFDLEGELVFAKTLTSPDQSYETWKNLLRPTPDGNFVNAGYSTGGSSPKAVLIKYDSQGEVLFTKEYVSPFAPADYFITMQGLQVSPVDSGLIMTAIVVDPVNEAHHTYLFKVDKEGNFIWGEVYYNNPDLNYTSMSLSHHPGGGYLVGGGRDNNNNVNINYSYRTYLFKTDENGAVEWQYLSPGNELQFWAADVLLSTDGGYIIASGKGTEYVSGNAATILWDLYIYKIDPGREFEWGVGIRDSVPSGNYLTKLIEVSDGSGYVAVGRISQPNLSEPGVDMSGIITKISTGGDSLWTRYHHYVVSPQDRHIFYDVEETSDGGFIMVGEARDAHTSGVPPRQQAWIVKVDEYGCLVPGCHLIDDTEEPVVRLQLSLYPNPTRDYLNVFYYDPQHSGALQFRILDLQGQVVQAFSSTQNNITHILPLTGYPAGAYVLQTERRGQIVSKPFVVVR